MAEKGQYAITGLIACNPKLRGTAICHLQGQCSVCPIAYRFEYPDKVPLIFPSEKEGV